MMQQYGLCWPIRRSFLRYIASMPDGDAVLDEGACASEEDGLVFPVAPRCSFDFVTGNGLLCFGGVVVFSGHFGMLRIRVASPRLVLRDCECRLEIAGADGAVAIASARVAYIATSDIAVWRSSDVRLLAEGARLFGDVYSEGEIFDPFVATLPISSLPDSRGLPA